jgi:hypothetical protein
MQWVGQDEQDGGDVNDEDEAPGWYLPASLIIAEVDCLVPVQGYPHQAKAGDVDTRSLDINIKVILLIQDAFNYRIEIKTFENQRNLTICLDNNKQFH